MYFVSLTRHARLCKAQGLFCWKATKSRSLLSSFNFHILFWLTILGKHLSLNRHGENINHTTEFINIIFHLLLYVTEIVKQSQIVRSGRFESSFLTLQGKPNTRMGNYTTHTIFPLSSWFVDQGHPLRVQEVHAPQTPPGRFCSCTRH